MDPILGTIIAFAGNFAPQGWVMCSGQLLSITQFTALFSLLGTTYGGDGRTTFGVPNLNGRMILGSGSGAGGTYNPGQQGGATSATLTTQQLPAHNHQLNAIAGSATAVSPANNFSAETMANNMRGQSYAAPSAGQPVAMAQQAIGSTGGGQPVPTLSPYTCINYIMAVQGIFPSRP